MARSGVVHACFAAAVCLAGSEVAHDAALPTCRCLPADPCWASVPWASLNASIGGRLAAAADPLAPCTSDAGGAACDAALASSDDEFWVSGQPGGYLHTGLYGVWNLTTRAAAYVVLAESEADVQAAVAFATLHNLRLVVKATGHDWYARSAAAGALVVWTHRLDAIGFDPAFVVCGGPPVPAATLGAGVQFNQLYAAAQRAGRLVIGGTCDSVGAVGCTLGGCFGTWSKLYGSGASNLLQARVVLPDGSLVTADACTHADLFWSLRGGGAGLGGVVTSVTARTHAPPATVLRGSHSFGAVDAAAFRDLLAETLGSYVPAAQAPTWGGSMGFGRTASGGFYVALGPSGFEEPQAAGDALLAPLRAFVAAAPARFSVLTSSWSVWNASTWRPDDALPWMEQHPDREISTALLASFSRYPPLSALSTSAGAAAAAAALTNLTLQLPTTASGVVNLDFEKGQAGASAAALALLAQTSQNPVLADATGIMLVMFNVPSLPTLPRAANAHALKYLWPRLKQYVVLGTADPLFAPCAAGAAGDAAQADACFDGWRARVPALQAQLGAARATLRAAFPDVDGDGAPFSGAYFHETDYEEASWQRAHWGDATYARLRGVKDAYDPDGLLTCWHCVGSEAWSADGNCRINATRARAPKSAAGGRRAIAI